MRTGFRCRGVPVRQNPRSHGTAVPCRRALACHLRRTQCATILLHTCEDVRQRSWKPDAARGNPDSHPQPVMEVIHAAIFEHHIFRHSTEWLHIHTYVGSDLPSRRGVAGQAGSLPFRWLSFTQRENYVMSGQHTSLCVSTYVCAALHVKAMALGLYIHIKVRGRANMGKTICYLCLADVAVRARQWDPGAALPLPFREHRQVRDVSWQATLLQRSLH